MISKKDQQQTGLDEVHEIMHILRGTNATNDGDYRSQHLGTVLEYLFGQVEEDKLTTQAKLALMLGMAARQVKENYLDGLIAFGIISLSTDCKRWKWIGLKAIKNKYGKLRKNSPEDNDFVKSQLTQPEESVIDYAKRKEVEKNVN